MASLAMVCVGVFCGARKHLSDLKRKESNHGTYNYRRSYYVRIQKLDGESKD